VAAGGDFLGASASVGSSYRNFRHGLQAQTKTHCGKEGGGKLFDVSQHVFTAYGHDNSTAFKAASHLHASSPSLPLLS